MRCRRPRRCCRILEDPPGPLSTMRYDGCADGSEVRIIRIDGLGHAWTHKEVDTTAVMFQLFENQTFPVLSVTCIPSASGVERLDSYTSTCRAPARSTDCTLGHVTSL